MHNELKKPRVPPESSWKMSKEIVLRKRRKSKQLESMKMADLVGDLGVYNRRALDERLLRVAERISLKKEEEVGVSKSTGWLIVMMDLDELKRINEASLDQEAGHAVGDAALYVSARTIMNNVRPWEIVARVGGDEFVTIMPSDSRDSARLIEEGLTTRLKVEMEQERQLLSRQYGDAWPRDEGDVKPGQISTGWSFMSEGELGELYKKYLVMPKELSNGRQHDFVSLVLKEADRNMMMEKSGKKLGLA